MIGTVVFLVVLMVCGYLLWDESDWTRWTK